MFFVGIGIWITGAFAMYIADGWFNWSVHVEDEMLASIFWPVFLPIFLATVLKKRLEFAKQNHLQRRAIAESEKEKIRVAVERELARLEEELQEEPKRRSYR